MMKPHAYPHNQEFELRFNILRADEVTELVEGVVSYQVLALTDGLHYRLTFDEAFGVSELEARLPAVKAEMACATEVAVYYISPNGLCEFTVQGIKLLTGEFFTEREWNVWTNRNSRPVYFDDRVFVFGDKANFIYVLGGDERRDRIIDHLEYQL